MQPTTGRRPPWTSWLPFGILALTAAFLLWTRLIPLDNSLWQDEIYSVRHYVSVGPGGIWGAYTPNDHMLWELLTWLTTSILGYDSEPGYRLLSVLPAIAAISILTRWLLTRLGTWEAAMFAVLAVTAPLQMSLGVEARGYGLVFLASAVMLIGADGVAQRRGRRARLIFAGGALLGILTVPTFSLTFVAVAAALMVRRSLRRQMLGAVLGVAVVSLVFYAPVLHDLLGATSQFETGAPLPWHGFVSRPLEVVLGPSVALAFPHISLVAGAIVSGAVLAAGAAFMTAAGERYLALLAIAPTLVLYLALEAARFRVQPRDGALMMLPLLIPCAFALATIAHAAVARARILIAVTALAAIAFSLLMLSRANTYFRATVEPPYENWRAAALTVHELHAPVILMASGYDVDLSYYLAGIGDRTPVPQFDERQLESSFCSDTTPLVYVQDFTAYGRHVPAECLIRRHAIVFRPDSLSPIAIWYVPPTSPLSATAIWCTSQQRSPIATRSALQPITRAQPFPAQLAVGSRVVPVRLHFVGFRLLPAIAGVATAAGRTFEATGRFLAIEYALTNLGRVPIRPTAINAAFGITGASPSIVVPVDGGSTCGPALDGFASQFGVVSPAAPLAPGQTEFSFALYSLPPGVASGPGELARHHLAWLSDAFGRELQLKPSARVT